MNWPIAISIAGVIGAVAILSTIILIYVGWCEAREDERDRGEDYEL